MKKLVITLKDRHGEVYHLADRYLSVDDVVGDVEVHSPDFMTIELLSGHDLFIRPADIMTATITEIKDPDVTQVMGKTYPRNA